MVLNHIISQAFLHHLLRDIFRKRHLKNHFNPRLVACLHHILQFLDCIPGLRIRTLRREPVRRTVSPIIPVLHTLLKIIDWHALNLVDAQICKVRQLLHHPLERPFALHLRRPMLRIPPDMQAICDHAVIRQAQRHIALPVIFLIIQDSSYFMFLHTAFPAPYFPAGNRLRIRIDYDFPPDAVVVFIFRWFYSLQGKITNLPKLPFHLINGIWFLGPGAVNQ